MFPIAYSRQVLDDRLRQRLPSICIVTVVHVDGKGRDHGTSPRFRFAPWRRESSQNTTAIQLEEYKDLIYSVPLTCSMSQEDAGAVFLPQAMAKAVKTIAKTIPKTAGLLKFPTENGTFRGSGQEADPIMPARITIPSAAPLATWAEDAPYTWPLPFRPTIVAVKWICTGQCLEWGDRGRRRKAAFSLVRGKRQQCTEAPLLKRGCAGCSPERSGRAPSLRYLPRPALQDLLPMDHDQRQKRRYQGNQRRPDKGH